MLDNHQSFILALLYPVALFVLLLVAIVRTAKRSADVTLSFTGLGLKIQFSSHSLESKPRRRAEDTVEVSDGGTNALPTPRS